MNCVKFSKPFFTAFIFALFVTPCAFGQERVSNVSINHISTDWNQDTIILVPSSMGYTGTCPNIDGYAVSSSQPGYKTMYAAALTALSMSAKINIIVDNRGNCTNGRPRMIGITVFGQ